jgi:hypothetical protein
VVVYPNPAKGPVTIQITLTKPADEMRILIFTTAFRKINEMTLRQVPAGVTSVPYDLTDRWGGALANTVYYVIVRVDRERFVTKLMILR